jgi:hypothetical protein
VHREGTRDREWERGARTPVTGREGVRARTWERGTERDRERGTYDREDSDART